MEIIVAKNAGFCFGVKRAIQLVEEALDARGPVAALGPVIHNPQVVRILSERGLRTVAGLDEVETGAVVIRSHGAPPHLYRSLEERGLSLVDATCPFVKKMHRQARQLVRDGFEVVIVGDRNHSEITSLTDDPLFKGRVVSGPEELEGVRLSPRVGLISQTTQTLENLRAVASFLAGATMELRVHNTICDATVARQIETRELAGRVDAMVVIGGRNSANTRRLVEISREAGARTLWVETAGELSPGHLQGARTVGLTAGASTPDWIIRQVHERIESLAGPETELDATLPQGRNSQHRR